MRPLLDSERKRLQRRKHNISYFPLCYSLAKQQSVNNSYAVCAKSHTAYWFIILFALNVIPTF